MFLFNLVEKRKTYFIISGTIIGLGILAMMYSFITTGSPFLLGVDFRGGARFEIQFTEPVSEAAVEEVFVEAGVTNPSIIALRGENLQNAWQIRTEPVTPEEVQAIEDRLNEQAPLVPDSTQVESVSGTVAGEVTNAAIIAVLVAAAIILVYIMVVFRQVPNPFRYGACAVVAMLHDLLVIFGVAALTGMLLGWEVDALFLTVVLTVPLVFPCKTPLWCSTAFAKILANGRWNGTSAWSIAPSWKQSTGRWLLSSTLCSSW